MTGYQLHVGFYLKVLLCFQHLIYCIISWTVIHVPGVETTRRFLLEWLSYTCRYVPVGLLDVIPQRLNWRPPSYYGRDDLETLMASDSAADWVWLCLLLQPIQVTEPTCLTT